MTKSYYIDTAIWRDLHENRTDKNKPLGELAFELFRRIRVNQERILYSDFVVEELSHAYEKITIDKIFRNVSELLDKVEINERQIEEAAGLSKELNIPFGDALHGLLARDNNAIMVTRDKHFSKLREMISVKKPEELI